MNIKVLPLLFCATSLAFGQSATVAMPAQSDDAAQNLNVQSDPPMLGIHWAPADLNQTLAWRMKPG